MTDQHHASSPWNALGEAGSAACSNHFLAAGSGLVPASRLPHWVSSNDEGVPGSSFGAGLSSGAAGSGSGSSSDASGDRPKRKRKAAKKKPSRARRKEGAADGAPDSGSSSSAGSDASGGAAAADEAGGDGPARKKATRKRPARKKTPAAAEDVAPAGKGDPEMDSSSAGQPDRSGDEPDSGAAPKARRKRRPSRSRASSRATAEDSDSEDRESASTQPSSEGTPSDGDSESEAARKRRRRGSRGGRRRKREDDDDAVAIDTIPGEDDDMDLAGPSGRESGGEGGGNAARDAARDPSRDVRKKRAKKARRKSSSAKEAEVADDDGRDRDRPGSVEEDDRGGRKKRKRRRSRRQGQDDVDDGAEDGVESERQADRSSSRSDERSGDDGSKSKRGRKKKAGRATATKTEEEKNAEAEALRVMTIAVNAAEPEERRVAVFKGDRITDFLMNAESQKTLVNDIYRGRVVNLEPAIGAAFVDFGQGRNGFLHTSDVLPVYGEAGFKLDDLLKAGIHDEEGDHDADWSEERDALDDVMEEISDVDPLDEDHDEDHDEADREDEDEGDDHEAEVDRDGEPAIRVIRGHVSPPSSSHMAVLGDDDGPRGSDGGGEGGGEGAPRRKKRSRSKKKAVAASAGSDSPSDSGSPKQDSDGERKGRSRTRSSQKASRASDSDGDFDGDSEPKTARKGSKKRAKASGRGDSGKAPAKSSSKKSSKGSRKKPSGAGSSRRKAGTGTQGRSSRERRPQRERRPIDQLLKVGDQVVVQITKDAIGDKGPTLTTYISMPGRYLVLMPSMSRTGVSRKIPDEKERKRLKRILASMNTPKDMGVIVRTAGVGRTKTDLQRDLDYLLGLWESFGEKLTKSRGPAPLYLESDVATRTLRDLFNRETKEVIVDDLAVHEQMVSFAKALMPEHVGRIKRHEGDRPLFQDCGIEQDFERIFSRRVDLPSGGSIVFDQAEALVAIDVNSGRTRTDSYDFEDIALKTNLEAVPEIARQIKLRDLGGIIVCDFIDMVRSSSNRSVEKSLRDELSDDRARSKLGRISQFGLLELTRQRLGPGTHKKVFQACPRCRGTGHIRSVESRAQAILRRLGGAVVQKGFSRVEVRAHPEVVAYLKEDLWDWVRAMEHRCEKEIILTGVPDQAEDSVLRYLRTDGREVRPGGRRKR